jgi:succinyl-diaminopimelate desuccinylase
MDVLELSTALVAIDSQNPGADEREIADFIESECRAHGFTTETFEARPGRTNLIVDIDGGGAEVLGFSGHLDTKPVGDAAQAWRTRPMQLTVIDGNAYGLGSADMKGAVAAMLIAAVAWTEHDTAGRLRLILTADEEAGSVYGAQALSAPGLPLAGAIVVGEPSGVRDSWEALFTVSRGLCCFTVTLDGTQGHSGLSARLPLSATVAAARATLALHELSPSYDPALSFGSTPTVNAGVRLEGGVGYGVHPGFATVSCDIRLVPGMDRDVLDAEIHRALDNALGNEIDWRVDYVEGALGWLAPAAINGDHRLVAAAQRSSAAVLGRELPLAAYPGGTDATAFILRAGTPTIASLGPGLLSVAHGPNEYVPVDDLYLAVDLYQTVAREYFAAETI